MTHSSRDPMSVVIPITVFYAVIFLAGVLGNVTTCTVISRNKSMHTATNFYLFNLAVSDLLLLVSGLPLEIYNIWYPAQYPFNQSFCILQGLLSETSTNATVLTITSFTVERYIAICHPFRQHTMSKLSRAVKFILAIWIVAFCLAIPQAFQFGIVAVEATGSICTVKNVFVEHAFEISSFIFFVGPMTLICIMYILIGVKLQNSKLLQGTKRKGISAQTRVIRMLVAVAVAFFLCWAPFHAQRLMAVYGSTVETPHEIFYTIYTALTYISGVLYFLSTCINPLLYNIMSHKFRDAFKSTLARHCGFGGKYHGQNHNYSALSRAAGAGVGGSLRLAANLNRNPNNLAAEMGHIEKRESDLSLIHGNHQALNLMNNCFKVTNEGDARPPPYHTSESQLTIATALSRTATADGKLLPTEVYNGPPTPVSPSKTVALAISPSKGSEGHSSGKVKFHQSALSTIAEKLRRSTKMVFHLKSSHNGDVGLRTADEKLKKLNSVDSAHSNTISNSSLQEMDEELNSSDLVRYMEEINNEIKN
ncbi:pyrokinin-1 receptor [Phlebotomus argentipes]|uniref:pyrokinin-1 receptor n=1 Tax=Phlebotomus argentipes TaxID=94469 RepID=UPI002892B6E1|nr:pyrokinin-1 receptor [Phlebotomus argentipes]